MNEVEIMNSVRRRSNIIAEAIAKYNNDTLKDILRMKIGNLMRNIRTLSGCNKTYFADMFGISLQTWTTYESGKTLQSLHVVATMMLITGTTLEDLFKGSGFYKIVEDLKEFNKNNGEHNKDTTVDTKCTLPMQEDTQNKTFIDAHKADISALGINVTINNISTDRDGVMRFNNYILNNIQKVKFLEFVNSLKSDAI